MGMAGSWGKGPEVPWGWTGLGLAATVASRVLVGNWYVPGRGV